MQRREFLTTLAGAVIAQTQTGIQKVPRKGRIKQAAMRTNFDPMMPFEDMCREVARLGGYGFDLIAPNDWPILKKYGLIPTMSGAGPVGFEDGVIRKELHDKMEKPFHELIDQCAAGGCPNIISVGGKKKGMSYAEGLDNATAFFNRVKAHAEDKGIKICIEVMNSKYENPLLGRIDQMCDHVGWAVELCKRVNSPSMKFLFDIYHVQIMDGNVVANIRDNIQYIGHFHTGGVPGR
ncbi:MAG TPA: sugar phosphate isomerase/epimerase family protein, partial [Terriglobia bacterium]|nr:sugar phosphate isomerase/epimerase family protein [Terriglobia bacterium]